MEDYKKFYNSEKYLFTVVHQKFQLNHFLSVFDFFCIVIWKANRAKSKVASRIRLKEPNLEKAVFEITNGLFYAASDEERLRILMVDWKLRLPMSSAVLSVFYPDRFTIYDYRVCEMLGKFDDLGQKVKFESIWNGYSQYIEGVRQFVPSEKSLRDKDKYLWGKSFCEDLLRDIQDGFPGRSTKDLADD